MRTAVIGATMLVIGFAAVVSGVLSVHQALAVGARTWPILLFVVAITIIAELAADAGLFQVIASRIAVLGANRAWVLWLLVVALSVVCTTFLSLDTTAVLLTPVVVLLARQSGLSPLPFALISVWLANTGSLLLPVSNLTNLLSEHALGFSNATRFVALMALPALAAIAIPCIAVFAAFRRDLLRRYRLHPLDSIEDRVLLRVSTTVVVAILPLLVSGIPVWIPASGGAFTLLVAFALRRPRSLRLSLMPWQLVLLASGLFLVIQSADALGLTRLLGHVAGTIGDDAASLLRLSGTSALGANLVNNLPAYLALEPVSGSPRRIAALLVGTNVGPLITPWASLATLLWHSRLTALGEHLSWRRYALFGLIIAPITVISATLALLI